jgi:hypothetical protein
VVFSVRDGLLPAVAKHWNDVGGAGLNGGRALDIDSAITFLIDNGLIDKELVLSNDIFVESDLRRNRIFQIATANGGFFIKQPDPLSPGSYETTRAEIGFYEHYASVEDYTPSFLTRLRYIDRPSSLLALAGC